MTVYIWTSKDSVLELRDHIYMHRSFRNSTRSLEGHPTTPAMLAHYTSLLGTHDELSIEMRVQFICDDPDYVVTSNSIPILWHSTTTAKETWICPLKGMMDEAKHSLGRHLHLIVPLVEMLNADEVSETVIAG